MNLFSKFLINFNIGKGQYTLITSFDRKKGIFKTI